MSLIHRTQALGRTFAASPRQFAGENYNRPLFYYACLLCCSTWLLLFIGGMVTSTGSGLAVPDWPTTFGQNMFTFPPSLMKGGILYEHGHRLAASLVGMLTVGNCLAMWIWERRLWLKWTATMALLLVIVQGVLGGLTVHFKLPVPVSSAHASTAELFFCLTVLMAFATSRTWRRAQPGVFRLGSEQGLALAFWLAVFAQIAVGAVMRHSYAGLAIPTFPMAYGAWLPPFWNSGVGVNFLHTRIGALMVLVLGAALASKVLFSSHRVKSGSVKTVVGILGALLLLQCLLGMLTVWSGKAPVIATVHLSVGALVLGLGFLLFLMLCRLQDDGLKPVQAKVPQPMYAEAEVRARRSEATAAETGSLRSELAVDKVRPASTEPASADAVQSEDAKPGPRVKSGPVAAFLQLMKLSMVFHILITTFVGYYLGSKVEFVFAPLWFTLIGTGALAIGAFALNQAMEKKYDLLMARTRNRPIPTERVDQKTAFIFGVLCFVGGTVFLWVTVNVLTAILGAATLAIYVAVYTPLKRHSSLNTLVGAIPGALPPLMGWTAAQNSLGLGGWLLFAVLFFWQMPHFLALALMYRDDYRLGGFKMLSVTDPTGEACYRHIILQTLILILVSLFPYFFRLAGNWYLYSALLAGGYFLLSAVALFRLRTREAARKVFFTSLVYLPVLLLIMAWDKAIIFV